MEILAFITAIFLVSLHSVFSIPNLNKKDELTFSYPAGAGYKWQRKVKEKKILKAGYKIASEEKTKEWGIERLIFLVIPILFPLIFFRSKKVKVIYKKGN